MDQALKQGATVVDGGRWSSVEASRTAGRHRCVVLTTEVLPCGGLPGVPSCTLGRRVFELVSWGRSRAGEGSMVCGSRREARTGVDLMSIAECHQLVQAAGSNVA